MTLPRGYKPPVKKKKSDSNDFGNNNNNITNKKENSLTNEILQSITIDDTIKEVLETSKEVVSDMEDTVKEVIEKGKNVIVGDSSIRDKPKKYEDQNDRSQLTQENKMNNNRSRQRCDGSSLCNDRAEHLFGTTINKDYNLPVNIWSKAHDEGRGRTFNPAKDGLVPIIVR